jgi:tetratricopeptide (TPR) repeat protein
MTYFNRLLAGSLMATVIAAGQAPEKARDVRIQGELVSNQLLSGAFTVELRASSGEFQQTVIVNPDGTFQFDSVPSAMLHIRVMGAGGELIYEEFVHCVGPNQHLSIRLPDASPVQHAPGDTTSFQELSHKVPGPARKAFERGREAEHSGRLARAEALLLEAVRLDPEFADAHNELGAVEVSLGKLSEAAAAFQKAIDVDPEHRLALPNLSIVLAKMHRFRDAGQVARRALRIAPQMAELHYILGISLVVNHGDVAEALANLGRVESEFPKAHLLEAQLLAEAGRTQEAAKHLRDYLKTAPPDAPQRAALEADLAQLERGSGNTDSVRRGVIAAP